MVKGMLENQQYFAVSANVVNNPALSWVHYSMGVNEPFWPVRPSVLYSFCFWQLNDAGI